MVWGTGRGALIVNLLTVVYDAACEGEQLALLFGLELCFKGIGSTIGPPVCGKFS